jgi:hypothetical protein
MGRKTEPIVIDAIREEVQFSVGEGPMDGKFVRTPVAFHGYASLERVMEDGETRIIRLSHVPPLATTVAPNDSFAIFGPIAQGLLSLEIDPDLLRAEAFRMRTE